MGAALCMTVLERETLVGGVWLAQNQDRFLEDAAPCFLPSQKFLVRG